jgi:hypothetical protein
MYKHLFIALLLFYFGILRSQELQQYQFNVHRFNDSVQVESCIPMNLYNELMTIPGQENTNKQIIQGIPMHVIGSKWVNNCLIINWPNIPNEEIISYILVFTKLREDQIIIIE